MRSFAWFKQDLQSSHDNWTLPIHDASGVLVHGNQHGKPEYRLIEYAKKIAINEGCQGFDTYFLAIAEQNSIPLFTDDLGMHRICERRTIRSWLLRDMDLKTVITT